MTLTCSSEKTQRLIRDIPFVITAVMMLCCLAIELLRPEISGEVRARFYSTLGSVSYCCSILLNVVYGRKYGLSGIKSLIFSFLSFQIVFSWVSVGWAHLDIAVFGGGAVASFRSAMFLPLLCVILSRFCKVDALNLCDYLTPYFFFHHGFVTIACWAEGCCAGKPMTWGLQNPLSGMTVFPLQPCIIMLSVAIAWWGLKYAEKHAYKTDGLVYANSLILYGFFRYLLELFSDDSRVFWVLSWLSVCSLVMIVQGFLVRYMIGKRFKTP